MKHFRTLLWCLAIIAAVPAAAQVTSITDLDELDTSFEPGGDFASLSLPGTSFRDLSLAGSSFAGSDLRGCIFAATDLQAVDFTGATVRGSIFRDSNLSGANFTGADLSGAVIIGADLGGTDLAGSTLDGASCVDIRLSSSGGSHVHTLARALAEATGTELSVPWLSALGGDAFAFTYNTELPGYRPTLPYYHHPVLALGRILQLDVKTHHGESAIEAIQAASEKNRICMIAAAPPESPVFTNHEGAVWCLVGEAEDSEKGSFELTVPLLGKNQVSRQELTSRWEGPWKTLYPAGHTESKATYPLITIPASETVQVGSSQAVAVLQNASRIISDPRMYGPLLPGTRGLARLSTDMYEAGKQMHRERMQELGEWTGLPRQCLAGGRSEAAQFCRQAAAIPDNDHADVFAQIAALFETEVALLTDGFPKLNGDEVAGVNDEDLADRFVKASGVIEQIRATEMRIADTIDTLGE